MKFLCHYIHRIASGEYSRTVFADSLNEATKLASRYTKKDYILLSVKQVL